MTAAPAIRSGPSILLLVAVAVAARAITFGNPIVHVDEQFYFATAADMWRGAIPYVDNWDRKPIGLFLIYLLPAKLGLPWGIHAYQLVALAALVATARLVMAMATHAGWRRGALWAAIAYVIWPDLLEGQGGQSPIFYNLLIAWAAARLLRRDASRIAVAGPAMFAVGLALQVKYSVVFEGIFLGLWCMVAHWRSGRNAGSTVRFGALLVAISLVPTLTAMLSYAAIGKFAAFWQANFIAILQRQANPLINQYTDLGGMMLILSPLLAMAVLVGMAQHRIGWTLARLFVFGWLAASVFGVLVFGTWFLHYGLPVLVPATVCAAGVFDRSSPARRWATIGVVAAAVGGQLLLTIKRAGRGDGAQFYALSRAVGQGSGCLYVYSGPALLYAATRHCRATSYTFPSSLTRDRDAGAIGVDQEIEIRRILGGKPDTIVMQGPFDGERAATRLLVNRALAQNYRLRIRLALGREMIGVYELRSGNSR